MASSASSRGFEIMTATMLGLISVVTALGAWQSASLDRVANEFGRDASDARDVSVNQFVLADYSRRLDQESSVDAREFAAQRDAVTDPLEIAFYDTRVQATLARATPGFSEAWLEWEKHDFAAEFDPANDPDYIVARDGFAASYSYASLVAKSLEDATRSRAGVLAQAALIQALALFLFGIAGVNRLQSVRAAVIVLGTVVFIFGFGLASTSFQVG